MSRSLRVLSKVRNGFSRIRNLANLALPDLPADNYSRVSTEGEQNMQISIQLIRTELACHTFSQTFSEFDISSREN